MPRRILRLKRVALGFALLGLVTACGQKSPLYLPSKPLPIPQPAAQVPAQPGTKAVPTAPATPAPASIPNGPAPHIPTN